MKKVFILLALAVAVAFSTAASAREVTFTAQLAD